MAFEYKDEIKNILLSMSLSERFPAGAWIGYGFEMRYSGSTTGSVEGVITMWDENILSTGTPSLQIYIPSSSYLDNPSPTSASLASIVDEYTDYIWSGSDNFISTQIIYAPGEVNPYACSATCYQGENAWFWNNVFNSATIQNPVNRQTTRPIKGGISITSTSQTPPYGPGGRGTMGLVCQDSASGALVGLTNNHVVVKNPFYTNILAEDKDTVFLRCDSMMDGNGGIVAVPWILLQEGYALHPEMIMLIEYENLCKEPEKTVAKIYEFLEIPYYSHDFENVEYSNENFDRACNLKDLHTVKRKVEYNPPKCILPLEIVKKYTKMNMEFWKVGHKIDADIIEKLDKKFIEYK